MAKGIIGKFDETIRERPEVKILVYFAFMLLLAVVPYTYAVYQAHLHSEDINASLEEAIFAGAAVGALLFMRYTPNSLPVAEHGLRFRGIVSQTAIGAAIGLALMCAIVNVLQVTGHYIVDARNHLFSPWSPLLLYLLVAIFEETVFRGFVFVTLEKKWGTFVGLTTTSMMFGLAHLVDSVPGISFGQHLRAALFIGVEAGVLLNAAFVLTRSLWLGIGIHWAWNFFEGPFYGTSVSGTDESAPLYIAHTKGPTIITGGMFGPENGIVCLIICTVAGLLLLRLAIRAGEWRKNPEIDAERI